SSVLKRLSPIAAKIGVPRLCTVISGAIVASEMTVTVAIRSPATIAGSASGNSTRHSDWRGLMPMPRAAAVADDRQRGRDREADRHRHERQQDVLAQRRPEHGAPVARYPVEAEQ